jgi:hypothetical protein
MSSSRIIQYIDGGELSFNAPKLLPNLDLAFQTAHHLRINGIAKVTAAQIIATRKVAIDALLQDLQVPDAQA